MKKPVAKPETASIPDRAFKLNIPDPETGGMTVALIGSTRSGKTTLLRHLLDKEFEEHVGVLMSPSLHAPIYKDIKSLARSPDYFPSLIDECYKINKECKNHYPFLMVLDDVVTAKFDKTLMKSFTIYRNSGITTIMSVQNPIIFNSTTRGNFNAVILGYLNSDEACDKVIRMFCFTAIKGKNIEEKIHEYKRLTADHHWLYIDHLAGDLYRFKLHL
jgi:GTPase SAR1 family protein